MVKTKRVPAWIAMVLVLGLVAAACGGDDEPGDDVPSPTDTAGQLTGGEWSMSICEPESLIPQNDNETCGGQVLEALFSPLVTYDPQTAEPSNLVAASIESDDTTTWTITLNDGWTFHDGTPVNSASFVDAWNWAAYGPNAAANNYFFENVEGYDELNPSEGEPTAETLSGLEVVDDLTFTVTLAEPFAQFALIVGYNAFYPLPTSFFDDSDAFNEAPVGNGPYQMDGSWEHDQFVRVVRYEQYAGPDPGNADAVEFRIYADLDVAYRDVQAGNLDIADVPDDQIEAGRTEFGDRFIETPSSVFQYIGFPLYLPQFQNKDLRHAFSLAIDRDAIIEAVFFNTRTPADDMVSPVVNGYREGACEVCVFDPELAQEKLEAAGGWEGQLVIWFNSDGGHETWIEAVSNMFRQNLGIEDIKFESLEFADYLGRLDERAITGVFRLGWVMDYPSMQNYLEPIHGCEGSSNNTGFCNEEVEELIGQGNSSTDPEEATSLYQQADDIILDELPVIPLWFGLNQAVHSERIDNVIIDVFSFVRVADVQVTEE